MDELDKVIYYVDGLKRSTRTEVIYQAPQTLQAAIERATLYDTAIFGIPIPRNNNDNFHQDDDRFSRTQYNNAGGIESMDLSLIGMNKRLIIRRTNTLTIIIMITVIKEIIKVIIQSRIKELRLTVSTVENLDILQRIVLAKENKIHNAQKLKMIQQFLTIELNC